MGLGTAVISAPTFRVWNRTLNPGIRTQGSAFQKGVELGVRFPDAAWRPRCPSALVGGRTGLFLQPLKSVGWVSGFSFPSLLEAQAGGGHEALPRTGQSSGPAVLRSCAGPGPQDS